VCAGDWIQVEKGVGKTFVRTMPACSMKGVASLFDRLG
jgi:hypothetical protein